MNFINALRQKVRAKPWADARPRDGATGAGVPVMDKPAAPRLQVKAPPPLMLSRPVVAPQGPPKVSPQAGTTALQVPPQREDDPGPCWNYRPDFMEPAPSSEHSPELMLSRLLDRKNVVVVEQSKGAVSSQLPIVSRYFKECSALIVRNMRSGKTLVVHHDTGVRSRRGDVSPVTPTRGFLAKERMAYEAFMQEPGEKRAILVDSQRGYDRREVMARIAADGAQVMVPLTFRASALPGEKSDALWSMVYRPHRDQLVVHMTENGKEKVMHFNQLLTREKVQATSDAKAPAGRPDIVDDLTAYRSRADKAMLEPRFAKVLQQCLFVAEMRHDRYHEAVRTVRELAATQCIPDSISKRLHPKGLLRRDNDTLKALGALADYCLAQTVKQTDTKSPRTLDPAYRFAAMREAFERTQMNSEKEDIFNACLCAAGYSARQPLTALGIATSVSHMAVDLVFAEKLQQAVCGDYAQAGGISTGTLSVLADIAQDCLDRSRPKPEGPVESVTREQGVALSRRLDYSSRDIRPGDSLDVLGAEVLFQRLCANPSHNVATVLSEPLAHRAIDGIVPNRELGFPYFDVDFSRVRVSLIDEASD